MLVDIPFLLLALLLLWFPRQWMRLGFSVRRRRVKSGNIDSGRGKEPWKNREPGDPAVVFTKEFLKFRNYFDLLRGAAGSLAVVGGMRITSCLSLEEGATALAGRELLVAKFAILLAGLAIQMLRFERGHFMFFAPIFYLAGISAALLGLNGALFAFLMIWAVNPMLNGPEGFLLIYAVTMLVFGWVFPGPPNWFSIVAAVYCLVPLVLSLLSKRPLVVLTRKGTHIHGA